MTLGTLHDCKAGMRDEEPFVFHLESTHVVFLGHTRQWEKPTMRVLILYTFNLLSQATPSRGEVRN